MSVFVCSQRDVECVAVCCSALQCVAVRCSVLQRVTVCCSALQCVAVCCSVLQCVAVCCSVLQQCLCVPRELESVCNKLHKLHNTEFAPSKNKLF